MTLERLREFLVRVEELHIAIDSTAGASRNATEQTPLVIRRNLVVDDLSVWTQSLVSIKDLGGSGVTGEWPMIDGCGGDESEVVRTRPLPKDERFGHVVGLEFGLGV